MPRRGETNLTAGAREAAIREYEAGAGLNTLAQRLHVAPRTLRAALVAAGVPLRSKGDTCRLRALAQHDSALWAVSPERWQELYWGEERPSLSTLAARMDVSVKHLRAVLAARGIRLRTAAEQLAVDGRKGRREGVGRPGLFTPAHYQQHAEAMRAGIEKRSRNAAWRQNNGLAHRKQEERRCQWCGAAVIRAPSGFRAEPARTYCGRSCAGHHQHHERRTPGAPRPLLTEQLLQALGNGPVTGERLERLAGEIGAGEAEIEAVLAAALVGR